MKLLLALQFWEEDKAQANKVARLVADLEPAHSEQADFLFSARFDCCPDPATVNYVARKFNTFTFINKNRRASGWPFGCNELWMGTTDYVYTMTQANKMSDYDAILFFEADACPLVPDWISQLSREWVKLSSRGAKVVGPLIPPGPKETSGLHINGNCLISGDEDTLHWLARGLGGCRPDAGWDWWLAPQFKKRGWANCEKMKSFWHAAPLSKILFQEFIDKGVVFIHGIKGPSTVQLVREAFLPGTLT